jgi:hypothetical protein
LSKDLPHIHHIKILSNAYGTGVLASLLDVSERAIQRWVAEPGITPRKETLRQLSELFVSHENGENVALKGKNDDYRDKYIKNLEEQVSSLKGQIRHLLLITQAKVETNQHALADLLVKQKIELADEVEDRLSKENLRNYEKLKLEMGIL